MALSERSRTAIYQALTPLTGEEAIGEMLSNFPTRDADEPVTRAHLDLRLSELRTELRSEMTDLRGDVHRDMSTHLRWLVGTYLTVQAATIALLGALITAVRP